MKPLTQEQAVLAHLKTGATISPLEALDKFGCFRLAGVIFNLRGDGYDIETQDGTSVRSGKTKHFAVYKLRSAPATPVKHQPATLHSAATAEKLDLFGNVIN